MSYAGFTTRATTALARPRSVSRNITPAQGGVTIHYGGPRVGITANTPHSRCLAVWRSWQNYHMRTHGWADIAYTGGFCQHGYLLAGRGIGVRTAANGTNTANQSYYALCWIGGDGDTPTQDALDACDEGILQLRAAGAGLRVASHQDWVSTSCAGEALTAHARRRDNQRFTLTKTTVASVGVPARISEDGLYGSVTHDAFMWVVHGDRTVGFTRDNVRDVQTWVSRPRTGVFSRDDIRAVQAKVSAVQDGAWIRSTSYVSNTTLGVQRFINKRIAEAS